MAFMRSRYLSLAFLAGSTLFAIASQPAAWPQPAAALIIQDVGPGMVPVDGDWQFHTGDDLGWADPAYDDSAWEHIKADDTWGAQTHPAYAGFAWYRRHLEITRSAVGNQQLAILMPPVDDAYELYWNGQKIGNQGILPPQAVWYYGHRQSFALLLSASGVTDGLLAVRVWKAPLNSVDPAAVGGLNALPVIGDAAVIAAKVGQGDFFRMRSGLYGRAISFFFLLIGTVSFLAWFEDRSKRLYFWFAVWLAAKIALFYLSSDRVIEWISATTFGCSLLILHSVENCSIFLLLLYLFNLQDNRRLRRWTWIVIGVNVGLGLADAFVVFSWVNAGLTMQWLDAIFTIVWTLCQLFVFVLLHQGFRLKPDLSRKLVAFTAFLVYVHELVRIGSIQGQRFTHWTLYSRMGVPLFHLGGGGITSRQILETLLLTSLAYALTRYAMEQRRRTAAIEMELRSAQEVQQVMIPEALPEVAGYAIESIYQSALEVGGDFFQIIPLADESTLVILGDVSGKGLKAAMNVALIVGTLRTLAEFDSSPAAMLNGLNRRLVGRLQGGFATTVAFRLVPSGNCTLANAGHLPPFLNSSEMTLGPSLPLGIDPDTEYEDTQIALHGEDRLTLYTDGVLEATNEDGELYGFERVTALLADRPDAASIAATARAFGQEDDITVLTITRLPVEHKVGASSIGFATS
jgi:phosphoserine phosphatase RsbU/P